MINFSSVKDSLYSWAFTQLGGNVPVVYYFPNAPRPTVDYISLYLSTFDQIGWDWTQNPVDNTGISEMVGDREFNLQVQGYGGDPISMLEILRTSLQKESVLDTLRTAGIVFVSWNKITDITALVDSRFEHRAMMDIRFRIAQIYSDDLGVINNVEVEEIIENSIGTIVFDETILI